MNQEKYLLEVLNEMIRVSEPIPYVDFNATMDIIDREALYALEKIEPKVGYSEKGITVVSLIATITDILIGKRLAVQIDEYEMIAGFVYYDKKD